LSFVISLCAFALFAVFAFNPCRPMKSTKPPRTNPTIRFTADLPPPAKGEKTTFAVLLTLPKTASAKLPSRTATTIEGTINGFPFRATLEPTNKGPHSLKITKALRAAADAEVGQTVRIEITRIEDESETRPPAELLDSLAANPRAQATWFDTTPNARRDWILWITTAKQEQTRSLRIKKACSMLASGKRRVCCFPGLNWLAKDHPSVETWRSLPILKDSPK
jgi:hypothetical protein